MKKMNWLVVLSVLLLSACGSSSSGGGDSGSQIAQASSDEFIAIMEYCFSNTVNSQVLDAGVDATKDAVPCTCPRGGTASLDTDTLVATMADCRSNNNYAYTGTVSFDQASGDVDVNFPVFGGCTGVEGTEITSSADSCSGSLTGTCGGDSVTCDFVPDGDDCNLDC